jgi:hypothetical protein
MPGRRVNSELSPIACAECRFNSSDRNVTPPIGMNADAEGLRFQRGALFPPLEWLARHRPIQIALVIGCALLFLVPTSLSNDSVLDSTPVSC